MICFDVLSFLLMFALAQMDLPRMITWRPGLVVVVHKTLNHGSHLLLSSSKWNNCPVLAKLCSGSAQSP